MQEGKQRIRFDNGDFVSRLDDLTFWWPHVAEILERHGLASVGREPVAGHNATYPTFLYGHVVVNLFGYFPSWCESHAAEGAAQALVTTDPGIPAPSLLAEGRLFNDVYAPWPYTITTRMSGIPWWRAELSTEQRLSVAADLGRQIRRVHALAPSGVATDADWPTLDVVAAAQHSSLPPHLIAQIDEYLARLGPFDRVFVHGDLVANHAYVVNGRLAGINDWGDAMVIDRHYELGKLYFDTFRGDKALLRVFLEASAWPAGDDFARKTLGLALYRQAVGLAQHHTFDVFHTLPALFSIQDVATELFAVM